MSWGFILGSVVIALSGLVVLLVGIANHREEVEHQKKLAKLRYRRERAMVSTGFSMGIIAILEHYEGPRSDALQEAVTLAGMDREACVNEVCGDEP